MHLFQWTIRDFQVDPIFPKWLRNQTFLMYVILQNARISGEIPRWLYKMFSEIRELDLSQDRKSTV